MKKVFRIQEIIIPANLDVLGRKNHVRKTSYAIAWYSKEHVAKYGPKMADSLWMTPTLVTWCPNNLSNKQNALAKVNKRA